MKNLQLNFQTIISNNRVFSLKRYTITFQETDVEMGISHERVRQIERKALAKVKANLIRQGYKADDCIDLSDGSVI